MIIRIHSAHDRDFVCDIEPQGHIKPGVYFLTCQGHPRIANRFPLPPWQPGSDITGLANVFSNLIITVPFLYSLVVGEYDNVLAWHATATRPKTSEHLRIPNKIAGGGVRGRKGKKYIMGKKSRCPRKDEGEGVGEDRPLWWPAILPTTVYPQAPTFRKSSSTIDLPSRICKLLEIEATKWKISKLCGWHLWTFHILPHNRTHVLKEARFSPLVNLNIDPHLCLQQF